MKNKHLPSWLTIKLGDPAAILETRRCIHDLGLHTVCEQTKCPNLPRCFEKKRATFLLLGKCCTRSCGFCAIEHSENPPPPDPHEPDIISSACQALDLKHVILTMVTRDDLDDGGAEHVAQTVRTVKKRLPNVSCEALISDLQGNKDALQTVIESCPDILAHNIETVASFTPRIRSKATFERSLDVLKTIKNLKKDQVTKSGLMVGLGETFDEVVQALASLAALSVDIVTIGQYLQPTPRHLPVRAFISPEIFAAYEQEAKRLGISKVFSGPFVRSSFTE